MSTTTTGGAESTSPDPTLLEYKRRARDYWSIDGLAKILTGFALLVIAALVWLYFSQSAWKTTIGFVLVLVLIVMLFGHQPALEWLKARITYPRTGYVPAPDPRIEYAMKAPDRSRWANLLSLRGWLCGSAGAVLADFQSPWICLVSGIIVGIAFYREKVPEKNTRKTRWTWVLGMPVVGLAMALSPFGKSRRLAELITGFGILFAVEGTVTLIRYLRRNPVARA